MSGNNEAAPVDRDLEGEIRKLERKVKLLERRNRKLQREAADLLQEKHLQHGEIVRLRRMIEAEHYGGH